MKDRQLMKLWEYSSLASTREPKTAATSKSYSGDPKIQKRTDLDVCLELFTLPLNREQAYQRLAATFSKERQPYVLARWRSTMLDGSPVSAATSLDLEVETVGITGWALDREHRGLQNEGGWSWVQVARAAYAMLSVKPRAA